jgi:hypothetical protein
MSEQENLVDVGVKALRLMGMSQSADAIEELLKGDKGNLAVHLAEPESRLTAEDIGMLALDAGFMLSTQYGQEPPKLMPVSDSRTLVSFARKVIKAHVAASSDTGAGK